MVRHSTKHARKLVAEVGKLARAILGACKAAFTAPRQRNVPRNRAGTRALCDAKAVTAGTADHSYVALSCAQHRRADAVSGARHAQRLERQAARARYAMMLTPPSTYSV